jgi:hypothetical protein
LPASGEGVQLADVDNDGEVDVCLATGFAMNEAAIHIYDSFDTVSARHPKAIVNEGARFGTVKFLVGSVVPDGSRDLFVWWCTGLGDGDAEFFRYRFGPHGLVACEQIATGDSNDFWPIDGQMALADMDGDGCGEVWFATSSGNLWRYTPAESPSLLLMCQITSGIGPIARGGIKNAPCLYLGAGSSVLQFHPD